VASPDGRNASTFTLVTLSEGVTTIVTMEGGMDIGSTYSTYNAAERVSVQGQLTASNALTATWSAEVSTYLFLIRILYNPYTIRTLYTTH
jgi:hypothetical protein